MFIPGMDHVDNLRSLVDAGIVHYNDRAWKREWLHMMK